MRLIKYGKAINQRRMMTNSCSLSSLARIQKYCFAYNVAARKNAVNMLEMFGTICVLVNWLVINSWNRAIETLMSIWSSENATLIRPAFYKWVWTKPVNSPQRQPGEFLLGCHQLDPNFEKFTVYTPLQGKCRSNIFDRSTFTVIPSAVTTIPTLTSTTTCTTLTTSLTARPVPDVVVVRSRKAQDSYTTRTKKTEKRQNFSVAFTSPVGLWMSFYLLHSRLTSRFILDTLFKKWETIRSTWSKRHRSWNLNESSFVETIPPPQTSTLTFVTAVTALWR